MPSFHSQSFVDLSEFRLGIFEGNLYLGAMKRDRRDFIKIAGLAGAGVLLQPMIGCGSGQVNAASTAGQAANAMADRFTLPALGYDYNALEPAVDAMTMEIHYSKHHAGYVKNLNAALKDNSRFAEADLDSIMKLVSSDDTAIRNNGGGHWNHSNFWRWMKPGGSKDPSGALLDAINSTFGSLDAFKTQFSDAAKSRFGSGWAWLSVGIDMKLFVSSTPNQDNPLMSQLADRKGTPILGIDVWEHAYYLNYQNRRPDYVQAFTGIINWDEVAGDFAKSTR